MLMLSQTGEPLVYWILLCSKISGMKGFSLSGRNLSSGLDQTSCCVSMAPLNLRSLIVKWGNGVLWSKTFIISEVFKLYYFFSSIAVQLKSQKEAPFNLTLFKGLWEMKWSICQVPLGYKLIMEEMALNLFNTCRPCLRRYLTRTAEIFSGAWCAGVWNQV